MQSQLKKFQHLLMAEACVAQEQIGLAAQNQSTFLAGAADLTEMASVLLQALGCAAVIIAAPSHPMMEFLLPHQPDNIQKLCPRDSESVASLHDIPVVYHNDDKLLLTAAIKSALEKRKGCFVEGLGIVSQASLTVEQAYITWSSILHALTIKYLSDILADGTKSDYETECIRRYLENMPAINVAVSPENQPDIFKDDDSIRAEMVKIGRQTIKLGLVDSFFGNISCLAEDRLYISQTAARLDELEGQIDCMLSGNRSTSAITASSELPAHHAVLSATAAKVLLHGHPRFSIIMSFFTTRTDDNGFDWLENLPVVDGESGIGGLAENLTRGFTETDTKAIVVRGHGIFAISNTDCLSALKNLADAENTCRKLFYNRLTAKI
jgi:ribulose-5-phosphate 4-epimerase/fuculose-1-phosphate aldolase